MCPVRLGRCHIFIFFVIENASIYLIVPVPVEPVLKALQKLFNSVILKGKTPKAWHRGVVVLFFKKKDNTEPR